MELEEAGKGILRVAVCDDNPMEAEFIGDQLMEYSKKSTAMKLESFRFFSGEELSRAYETGQRFDICLLDIVLPGIDGLTLAKTLQSDREKPEIIFLTNSEEYILEAWQVRASGYLVKPVSRQNLFEALDTASAVLAAARRQCGRLSLPEAGETLSLMDVIMAEIGVHSLRFCLVHGNEIVERGSRAEMAVLVKQLESAKCFLKPSRSQLVNAAHVDKLGKHTFLMDNGVQVRIGKTRFTSVRQQYADYLTESGGW